jgi:hypothetical protein
VDGSDFRRSCSWRATSASDWACSIGPLKTNAPPTTIAISVRIILETYRLDADPT